MDPISCADCEMLSQTEAEEDTDGGAHMASTSSDLNTTTEESASCPASDDPTRVDGIQQKRNRAEIAVEKSVDLTDVTELSNLEDFSGVDRKHSYPNKFDDDEKEVPKFDFSGDWFNKKCFQRYWTHYHSAMAWCQKHYETYHTLQQKYYSDCNLASQRQNYSKLSNLPHPYTNMSKPESQLGKPSTSSNNSHGKHKRRRRHRKSKSQSSQSHDTSTQTSEREEFEMEITPEMVEFFKKSQEHREQRDEEKKVQDNTEEERERINVEEVLPSSVRLPSVAPPRRRPGAKRTEEMKVLYGKGAPMIHGMETALQMTFDRNVDIKQPKLWPNMPLKITFA